MTNIGFLLNPTRGWMGGVNYYRNLLRALDSVAGEEIRLLVFVPPNADQKLVDEICRGNRSVQVVRTALVDRRSPLFVAWKLCNRFFRSDVVAQLWLRRYRIGLFSHSGVMSSSRVPAVNWIPDFQHVEFPEFFTPLEVWMRNKVFRRLAEGSDAVILSSETALNDFRDFVPECAGKGRVLRFVSQVPEVYWGLTDTDADRLRSTYGISGPFFYLPNQFWKHKNHLVAFEAISLLRQRGIEVSLVCSGALEDSRNPAYIDEVKARIAALGCADSVKLLGLVPYADVYALIRFSVCVINPSLFEGWSSTVEECKSVNKRLVLSDIPVHREQAGEVGDFFRPDAPAELADILARVLSEPASPPPPDAELKAALQEKTRAFGQVCLDIYREVLAKRA